MGDEISRENINTTLSDPKKEKNKCKKKGLFVTSIVGARRPMDSTYNLDGAGKGYSASNIQTQINCITPQAKGLRR
jgi:hypothetical protein